MVGPRGGWAARFVRLLLAFPAEGGVEDVSGASRGRDLAVGVGRGIFLQLLRLSRETGPGHVGGRQGGESGGRGGGRSLRRANPRPISRKTAGGRVLKTARTLARPARHAPFPPRR